MRDEPTTTSRPPGQAIAIVCTVLVVASPAMASGLPGALTGAEEADRHDRVRVEVGPVETVVTLRPADPRLDALALEAPTVAEGLLSAPLPAQDGRLHLVETPDATVGVLATPDEIHWVALEGGTIVPADVDATLPPGALEGDTRQAPSHTADRPGPFGIGQPGPGEDGELEIALHGDAFYREDHPDDWREHQLVLIHLVDAMYRASLDVPIEVVDQTAHEEPSEDLTSHRICRLLFQFRHHMEDEHGSTVATPREAGHLFTTRSRETNVIGCAFLRVLETRWAYGVSQLEATYDLDDLSRDSLLVAHELGHNFDAVHRLGDTIQYCTGATIMRAVHCLEHRRAFSGARTFHLDVCEATTLADCVHGNAPRMVDHASGRI